MNQVRRLVPGWFATMIVASAAVCLVGLSRPEISGGAQAPAAVDTVDALAAKDLYDVLWLDKYPEMASHEIRIRYQPNSICSIPIAATPAADPMIKALPPVPVQ